MTKKKLPMHPIRLRRKRALLTQTDLAKRAGISLGLVSMIEARLTPLQERHVKPIADALGISKGTLVRDLKQTSDY